MTEPARADRAGDQTAWPAGPNGPCGMILPVPPKEAVAESPSPRVGEECPQTLLSRAGRQWIPCAQVNPIGGDEETLLPNCPSSQVRMRFPVSAGPVHELNNLVTRSVDPASICDPAGSPCAVRLAELIRSAFRARHGRGAFTTDLRGGLSQWYGGRLGSLDSWYGPRTASAVACRFDVIAPPLKHLMSAVCSRPVPVPA